MYVGDSREIEIPWLRSGWFLCDPVFNPELHAFEDRYIPVQCREVHRYIVPMHLDTLRLTVRDVPLTFMDQPLCHYYHPSSNRRSRGFVYNDILYLCTAIE